MNFKLLLNNNDEASAPPRPPNRFSINSMINPDETNDTTTAGQPPGKTVKKPTIDLLTNESEGKPQKPLSSKPKKYTTPPVWAENWIPLVSDKPQEVANEVERLRGRTSYNPQLDVSITKVTPYEDLTRRITQWLYSHLSQLRENEPRLLQYVELEIKLGRIWSKEKDARADLPISTETILTNQIDYYFKPGVENSMFAKIEDFIVKLNQKDANKAFTVLKSDTQDLFYQGLRRGDKPYDLRVSKDVDTKRIIDQIEKKRLGDLFILNPSNILDFRVSLSLELPIEDIPKQILKENPSMTRRKIRTSYVAEACQDKIDLTRTLTTSSNSDKKEQNFEIELEINTGFLLAAFEKLFSSEDNQTYEDTIRVLLDNCRILNRCL